MHCTGEIIAEVEQVGGFQVGRVCHGCWGWK